MSYLVTLILTFLFIALVLWLLTRVRTPRYRLERDNVLELLDRVAEGRATEHDWNVFTGIPIRHDAGLEAVRRRCQAIGREHYIGGERVLGREGLEAVRTLRDELRSSGP